MRASIKATIQLSDRGWRQWDTGSPPFVELQAINVEMGARDRKRPRHEPEIPLSNWRLATVW